MRTYGSGSVESYRGKHRARAPRTADGRRPVLGIYNTLEDANDACDVYADTIAAAGIVSGSITLRAWGARYLDRRELGHATGQDGPARNISSDRSHWRLHIDIAHFADWPLPQIARRDIKEWMGFLASREARDVRAKDEKKRKAVYLRKPRKISAQTRKHCLNLLRVALDEAVEDELISVNPAKGVKAPKVGEIEFDYLSLEEQHAIERSDKIAEADKLRAMFAWGTGIRQFDQWTLKLSDLRLDQADPDIYFWCHKLGRKSRVPLFGVALRAVKRWLELLPEYCPKNPKGLVWPLPSGCQRQKSKNYGWPELLKAAGVKRHVTWHELRDTCASSLVSGVWGRAWRLEEVRDMLDHSTIKVTERYAHLAPAVLDAAARGTIGHQLATTPPPASPDSPAISQRATQNSNLRPSASEARGAPNDVAWLGGPDGRLVANSVALIEAQARGDATAANRLAFELATAVLAAADAAADRSRRVG